MAHQPGSLDDFAWADPPLRQRLVAEPAQVLAERGVNVPPHLPRPLVHEALRIVSLLWLDGRVVPLEHFRIDPADEGLLFGRGVWESTRTVAGVPWLWPLHAERMLRTAELLDIDLPARRLPDETQVAEFVRGLTAQDVVVRVNATAGRPGGAGVVWMTAALRPLPTAPVKLKTCPNPVPVGQPYLTWKTFQYATRLRVGRQAWETGFDSALLLDADDNLLEASHANVFVRLPEGWVTPAVGGGLLPGTVRRHLLENSPVPVREAVVPRARLAEATEAFVTNSNVGVVPVAQIDDWTFPVGAETQQLVKWALPGDEPGKSLLFVRYRG